MVPEHRTADGRNFQPPQRNTTGLCTFRNVCLGNGKGAGEKVLAFAPPARKLPRVAWLASTALLA